MAKAIIIYGPPGSGKGTQAELIVRKFGFIHFDTGRYLEELLRSKAALKNPVLRREKNFFDKGILCTPSWVLKIVSEAVTRIGRSGASVVFSGSPRTLFEAFGDPPALTSSRRSRAGKKQNGLLATLDKIYGRKNILVVKLKVRPDSSIQRNSGRVVCSVCGLPALRWAKIKNCPFCAGPFRKRTLDKPEVIKIRLKEYKQRTYPLLARAKRIGYRVIEINGEPKPYRVFGNLVKKTKING